MECTPFRHLNGEAGPSFAKGSSKPYRPKRPSPRSDPDWRRSANGASSNPGASGRASNASRNSRFTPSIEAGIRRDGGDAEEGTGFEMGAGLRYQAGGISIEGAVRALLAHEDTDYREWGASGAIRIAPGATGRGLSLSIAPAWGNAASGAERMWSARDARGLTNGDEFEAESRLEAELGYGLRAPWGLGAITPYTALTLSAGASRTWRAGARWKISEATSLSFEGTREERGGEEAPSGALMLRASVRF